MTHEAAHAELSALETTAQPNALEQQRHERIKLNNAKMAAIGLLPPQQPAKRPRSKQVNTSVLSELTTSQTGCQALVRLNMLGVWQYYVLVNAVLTQRKGTSLQKENVERPAAAQTRQSARLRNVAPEHAPPRCLTEQCRATLEQNGYSRAMGS